MTVYVVNEVGFMYNDENYYPTDDDAGLPVKAYRKKEDAEKEANRLNDEKVAQIDEESYQYDNGMSEDWLPRFYTVSAIELHDAGDSK